MLRPRTLARNACLTQPLGPFSRAMPETIVSGSTPPPGAASAASAVVGGFVGGVGGGGAGGQTLV